MDEKGDYPIKVLDIAPLIMVSLLHERVLPSRWLISLRRSYSSLSLACGWPPGANVSLPVEWRRLQGFRVENPSGARKGGRTDHWSGLGRLAWADRPGPTSARFGRPFAPVDPHVIMYFAPSTCMILTMSSSRPRWRFSSHEVRSFTLQFPGVFLIALRSLPPLEVISSSSSTRTRLRKCSFELVVNPSFKSKFSYINTTLPNACT
jgi:hypothetical protein